MPKPVKIHRELRNWKRLSAEEFCGEIFNDSTGVYKDGSLAVIKAYSISDFTDYYIVKTLYSITYKIHKLDMKKEY